MQTAATINDAARRLEEATAIYRFKSRSTVEEFDELGGQWMDSRGRHFGARFLQPQRESIEEGARLCRMHAELIANAQSAANVAERESTGFVTARDEFESAEASGREAVQSCREIANRANADSSRTANEISSINAGIAAASADPGW